MSIDTHAFHDSFPGCTDWGQSVCKWGGGVLNDTSSGWLSLALRQDPCTQMMTLLNICAWLSMIHSTLASIHHHLLLSDHLLPSNCFHLSWPFHSLGSCAIRLTITHAYHGLSPALWFLSLLRQGMECGGRWDNGGQGATWRQ